jgi:hypothetical protein
MIRYWYTAMTPMMNSKGDAFINDLNRTDKINNNRQPRLIDQVIPARPVRRAARQATPAAHPAQPAPSAAAKPKAFAHLEVHPLLRRQSIDGVVAKQSAARPTPQAHRPQQPQAVHHTSRPLQQPALQQPSDPLQDAWNPPAGQPPLAQGLTKDNAYEHVADKLATTFGRTSKLVVISLTLVGILVFLSAYSLKLGQLMIAIYAIVAIWRKLSSRLTFILALAMFGGIIIAQVVSPDSGIADNLAVYAFLLLCVGTFGLAREVRSVKQTNSA